MKSLNLKAITQLLAFASILTTGASAQFRPGQTLAADAHSLIGTWKVTVSPDGIPPFQAYNVFTVDGNSFEFDNSNPPASQTIAVGPWTNTGVNSFAFTEVNQLFDGTGAFVGELKVRATIALTGSGDTFTSKFKFDVLDPGGNSVFSGSGTAVGKRVVVEGQ
jgi:hypothetical protein